MYVCMYIYFIIQTSIALHLFTCSTFRRGAPGGSRTLKKNLWYLKMISTRVCKKIFLIKAKKKFCTGCPKIYDQNLHFWIFSKNSFRNELKAPFLLNFDTHDLTCKNFHFDRRGAPGGPRTLQIDVMMCDNEVKWGEYNGCFL